MSNWHLMKNNREERIICIDENDVESFFNWYYSYKKNYIVTDSMRNTSVILEDAPNFTKKIDFTISKKNLKDIHLWYSFYKNPSSQDLISFKIIDEALNPKELKK